MMSAVWPLSSRHDARSGPAWPALLPIALMSVGAMGILHGHACTGDGCVPCLAIACARALLAMSLGAALVCPILRIVFWMHAACGALRPCREPVAPVRADRRSDRVRLTPVTMGVQLLI